MNNKEAREVWNQTQICENIPRFLIRCSSYHDIPLLYPQSLLLLLAQIFFGFSFAKLGLFECLEELCETSSLVALSG